MADDLLTAFKERYGFFPANGDPLAALEEAYQERVRYWRDEPFNDELAQALAEAEARPIPRMCDPVLALLVQSDVTVPGELGFRFRVVDGMLRLEWNDGAENVPEARLEGGDLVITAGNADDYYLDGSDLMLRAA